MSAFLHGMNSTKHGLLISQLAMNVNGEIKLQDVQGKEQCRAPFPPHRSLFNGLLIS